MMKKKQKKMFFRYRNASFRSVKIKSQTRIAGGERDGEEAAAAADNKILNCMMFARFLFLIC